LKSDTQPIDFSELVKEHYSGLYKFGYSLAKKEHEASDLVQQTFLIYAEKGSAIRDRSKVKSWLFTTLYREFLRLRRRGATTSAHEPELLEAESPPVDPTQAQSLQAQEALAALEQLEEGYRVPLTLFYLQELSYKEIANVLDLPIGTVMSRLSRGKDQLRAYLTENRASAR